MIPQARRSPIAQTLLLGFLFLIPARVPAQLVIGVKGGPSICTMRLTSTGPYGFYYHGQKKETRTGTGWHFGVMLNTSRSAGVSLRCELLWSVRRTTADYDFVHTNASGTFHDVGTETFDLSYVEIPVMPSIQLSERVGLQAGVCGAVLSSVHDRTQGTSVATGQGSSPGTYDIDHANTDALNGFSLGVLVGATYDFPFGAHFGARYLHDINNAVQSGAVDLKTDQLQISIGFGFHGEQ